MAVVARWRLHPLHLYLVRTYLRLEDLTLPLEGPSYGKTAQQVAELARREESAMRSWGILINDEVDPNLAAALGALTKPYLWVDSLWYPRLDGDDSWRSVAVGHRQDRTVVGVQTPGETERFGGVLTVEVHEKATPAQALLPTLPPTPPGNRQPAKVPAGSFREQPEEQNGMLDGVGPRKAGSGDKELALFHAISKAPHVRGGQLAANTRSPQGKITRSTPLLWFDNPEPDGRYLSHTGRTGTGEQLHLLTPADARLIGGKLDALMATVQDAK